MACPAQNPDAHAHWKLNPPSCPVTSTTSPTKYKPWNLATLHGFSGKFIAIDTSRSHFRLLVPFCAAGGDLPVMCATLELCERAIGPLLGSVQFEPAVGESLRKHVPECRLRRFQVSPRHRPAQGRGQILCRRQIDCNRCGLLPVRGNLQDRRAAQAAMCDQHLVVELVRVA